MKMNWRFRNRRCSACGDGQVLLSALRPGQKARVSCINAGCKARVRLAALGLIQGTALQVVANAGVGPLLLSVGESRLMVERGVAEKVLMRNPA